MRKGPPSLLSRADRLYYSQGMRPLTLEDDLSKYHEVAIYHWSDKRTAKQAMFNDLFLRILEDLGEENGWHLHGYFDWDIKRKSTRPGFDFMMKEARQRKFELIVCIDLTFLFPGAARETVEIIRTLDKLCIRYCSMWTLLYPIVDIKVELTLIELFDFIRNVKPESDSERPEHPLVDAMIREALRELHSAKSRMAIDKKRQKGEPIGRRPRKRDEVRKLIAAGHSVPESAAQVGASLATGYRAYNIHRKSRSSLKNKIA
jgi:DNA invertase Pin-like site-specific DNA recombinase